MTFLLVLNWDGNWVNAPFPSSHEDVHYKGGKKQLTFEVTQM